MGTALLAGLTSSGWATEGELAVTEKLEPVRRELEQRFPSMTVSASVVPSQGAVLAVKPDDARTVCGQLAAAGVTRVLSIAAGVRLSSLGSWLGSQVVVVRAMPNTPALLGSGASAVAGGPFASPEDVQWATSVLGAVGTVVEVPEELLDAVTGLSGSGPAYVFLVAEALIEAGVANGLPAPVSRQLALQTIHGASRMLLESGPTPGELRAQVTSPRGATAAALEVLEEKGLRQALVEAVSAATHRSKQLGSE